MGKRYHLEPVLDWKDDGKDKAMVFVESAQKVLDVVRENEGEHAGMWRVDAEGFLNGAGGWHGGKDGKKAAQASAERLVLNPAQRIVDEFAKAKKARRG